ncbi:unnamed protein product [Darwinula stevensoni]|uniref:Uncharacterized protein n=1 Tax=Darwinula stevensoni TaxID=69355 RepID=A0A7R9AIJ6_9CRUS|nr:unnamed protein product [Darwinula stevensoni]CAG0906620.1 unnamed protein product [Darwinula stevensoni]
MRGGAKMSCTSSNPGVEAGVGEAGPARGAPLRPPPGGAGVEPRRHRGHGPEVVHEGEDPGAPGEGEEVPGDISAAGVSGSAGGRLGE